MKEYGNTVLVIDGTQGFQFELAKAFSLYGNTVIVSAAKRSDLDSAQKVLPLLKTYQANMANPAERTALFELLKRDHSDLNILVSGDTHCSCCRPGKLLTTNAGGLRGERYAASVLNLVATEFLSYRGVKRNSAVLNVCGTRLDRSCRHTLQLQHALRHTPVRVIQVVSPSRLSRLITLLQAEFGNASRNRDANSIVRALPKGESRVLARFDSQYLHRFAAFFHQRLLTSRRGGC